MMTWVGTDEWDDTVYVCITHLRFIPCRVDSGCHITDLPAAVEMVRAYQQGADA